MRGGLTPIQQGKAEGGGNMTRGPAGESGDQVAGSSGAGFNRDGAAGGVSPVGNSEDQTVLFRLDAQHQQVGQTLRAVYRALQEKGYEPVSQIVGYLLSGDPTYITSHNNARTMIRAIERDEILELLVESYLKQR